MMADLVGLECVEGPGGGRGGRQGVGGVGE